MLLQEVEVVEVLLQEVEVVVVPLIQEVVVEVGVHHQVVGEAEDHLLREVVGEVEDHPLMEEGVGVEHQVVEVEEVHPLSMVVVEEVVHLQHLHSLDKSVFQNYASCIQLLVLRPWILTCAGICAGWVLATTSQSLLYFPSTWHGARGSLPCPI